MKIDLGGVILGAIVGIGALLILPKFLGAFSGQSSGGYYRSKYNFLTFLRRIKIIYK